MRRFGENLDLNFFQKITKFENLKIDVKANFFSWKKICNFLFKFEFYVEF